MPCLCHYLRVQVEPLMKTLPMSRLENRVIHNLSICLSVSICLCLSVCDCLSPSVCLLSVCVSVCLSVSPSLPLSCGCEQLTPSGRDHSGLMGTDPTCGVLRPSSSSTKPELELCLRYSPSMRLSTQ